MMRSHLIFLSSFLAIILASATCIAQSADNRTSAYGRQEEDRPLSIMETMVKMRIEQEKKEFGRMLERGEEALKIASELERAVDEHGGLTGAEVTKLAAVEKLAKQIRNDLGGDDDETDEIDKAPAGSTVEAVRSLRSLAEELCSQLRKTSRFTISAAAIQSSNAVLRLSRFLRISK